MNYYELFSEILLEHICYDKVVIEREIHVKVFRNGCVGYVEYVFNERKEFIRQTYRRW